MREGDGLRGTPLLLTVVAIMAADSAFAIDSIPAVFAVTRGPRGDLDVERVRPTRDRALLALVDILVRRFRYACGPAEASPPWSRTGQAARLGCCQACPHDLREFAPGPVQALAIDEKGRRRVDPSSPAALDVGEHALSKVAPAKGGLGLRWIELKSPCYGEQVVA